MSPPITTPGSIAWLVKLRWVAIVVQSLLVFAIAGFTSVEVPVLPLQGLLAFAALTNVALSRVGRHERFAARLQAGVIGLDVLLLTFGLHLSGGPMNPFSFLYVAYVALAASVLPRAERWVIFGLSAVGYGALYLLAGAMLHHDHHMSMHLQGMWLAMTISAGFVVSFIGLLRAEVGKREQELLAMRESEVRHERLAGLATLAAGAAHELATPLSTIAVAAREIERELGESELAEEARIIRQQTDRCRAILDRLSIDSGQAPGEGLVDTNLVDLVRDAGSKVSRPDLLEYETSSNSIVVHAPPRSLCEAVKAILQNAIDSGASSVLVAVSSQDSPQLRVVDNGRGIPAQDRTRIAEPFFTTKGGDHMGLGLFVASELMRQLGGRLDIEGVDEGGTAVLFRFRGEGEA